LSASPAHRSDEGLNAHDRDHPFDIVGQHTEAHFGFHALDASCQEVRVAYPRFDRAEGVIDCSSANGHSVVDIQQLLHRFDDALMLPAIDAAFLAGRAFRLQRASAAFSGLVAMERSSLLEARISISERHSRRTAIYVLIGKIDEVILAESPCGLRIRDEWLGHVRRGTDGLAGENFLAAE